MHQHNRWGGRQIVELLICRNKAVVKKGLNIYGLFSTLENRFEAQARQLCVIRLARKGLGFTRCPMSPNKPKRSLSLVVKSGACVAFR
jgi:hypothetical protein